MAARLVTERDAAQILERLSQWPSWTYDTETTGIDPCRRDVIVGASVEAYDKDGHDGDSFYFPFRHRAEPETNLSLDYMKKFMGVLGTRETVRGWNVGFDARFSWNEGAPRNLKLRDVMLDSHLVDENSRSYGLKPTMVRMFGPEANRAEKALEFELASILGGKGDIYRLSPSQTTAYACDDVSGCRAVSDVLAVEIERQGLENVAVSVSEYCRVVAGMEHRGIQVDHVVLKEATREAKRMATEAYVEAHALAGRKIALNNPAAVCAWLGIASSNDKYLDRIKNDPRVDCVRKFRHARAAYGSYYKKFLAMSPDEILHADMLLHGTISGRLAVRNPPLQSLPTDTETYRVKEALLARPGYVLVQADYKLAELCMASHYGKERRMLEILRSGRNVHTETSKQMGIPRPKAKRINFSIVHGIGAESLAENLDVSEREAAQLLKVYHRTYPGFRRIFNAAHDYAETHGHITMWSGRRRHYNERTPTHKASSNLIQGGVNELMREAQTALDNELHSEDVHQLLQVHDAAYMEMPEEEAPRLLPMVREIMEDHERFSVPFTVDINTGKNAAQMEEWTG